MLLLRNLVFSIPDSLACDNEVTNEHCNFLLCLSDNARVLQQRSNIQFQERKAKGIGKNIQ